MTCIDRSVSGVRQRCQSTDRGHMDRGHLDRGHVVSCHVVEFHEDGYPVVIAIRFTDMVGPGFDYRLYSWAQVVLCIEFFR